MSRRGWIALLLWTLAALVAGWLSHGERLVPVSDARVPLLRDSLARERAARVVDLQAWGYQLRSARADSLTSWLRARAARPLPRRIDSILVRDTLHDTLQASTADSAPSVCLSDMNARRLLARDSVRSVVEDSLRGSLTLDSARLDSVRALLRPSATSWSRLGIAFGAGYLAGIATCILVR